MDQRERELLAALRASRAGEKEQPPKKETELSLPEWIWEKEEEWKWRLVEAGRAMERLSLNEEENLTAKQIEKLEDALSHWKRLWWDFAINLHDKTKAVLIKEGKLVAEFDPAMPGKIRLGKKYRKNF